ncbi:uncharacterized protein LOC128171240 [Crassostrea angulata]|uniref:uncharacterized protein LOC128171240 n=1 Tax=Magallana angulata TaxID=2784310 RepID=UPI0022B0A1C4|nr:uncharacterized protein LOC128171240 [Crassostrea angulata]
MRVSGIVLMLALNVYAQVGSRHQYIDYRKPQPISRDIICLDGGPISFRPRPGASIPNCLPAPGPVKRSNFLNISIYKSVPYHCPGKGYVCGYSRVPMDNYGNVQVKCCTAVGVTYDERECVRYFRFESPQHLSPTKPGYFLVSSTPFFIPKNNIGFYNKECPFHKAQHYI